MRAVPGFSRLHFGLGEATAADLEVLWPSGFKESFPKVPADRVVTIREGDGIIKTEKL